MKSSVALLAACALSWSATFATDLAAAETPAACAAKTKASPAECFVSNAKAVFEFCRAMMQVSVTFGTDMSSCVQFGAERILEHYNATLQQFTANTEALNLTKNYYALWRAAMSSLVPTFREPKIPYEARISRQAADLVAAGERLLLEK